MDQEIKKITENIWQGASVSAEMLDFVRKAEAYISLKSKLVLEALENTEARYELVVEGTSAGIWDWIDMKKDEQWWSPHYYKLLGFVPGEITASYSNFLNLLHPDDIDPFLKHIRINFENNKPISIEYRLRCKNGSYKWFLANGKFSKPTQNDPTRIAGSIIDISDRKSTEEKLKYSEERFRNLIESARDIFFTTDILGNYTYVNEVVREKLGYDPSELIGINYTDIVHPDHRNRVKTYYLRQVTNRQPFSYLEFPAVGKNGELIWVGQNAQLIFRNNEYEGVQAVVHDITNIKNAEKALMQSEERFRKLVQYSSDVTTIINPDGTILYLSPSFFRLFGYRESLVGKNAFELIHPDDVERAMSELQRGVEKGGVSDPIEFRFRTPDGKYKYIETIGNNLLDEPTIQGIVLNSREITERKKVEAALAETSGRLTAVLESTDNIIFAIDIDYRYIAFNSAHKRSIKVLYGVDIEIGQTSLLFNHANAEYDRNILKDGFDRCLAGDRYAYTHETKLNNRKLYFDVSMNSIRDRSGMIIGVAVFSQDVTGKKEAEIELSRAKEEAESAARTKSDFLSNMSHEIRTPMNAIVGLTELLLEKELEKDTNDYLKSIQHSAENLLVVINEILDFSKIESGKITLERADFDLHHQIDEIMKLFRYKAKEKNIELKSKISTEIPKVLLGDPFRLNQILINLVGNAVKFTEEGFVHLKIDLLRGDGEEFIVGFSVKDSGIGIPFDKQNSVFESFTQANSDTTRRFGGTGLGLSITKNLVLLMGGQIKLNSTLKEGTEFYVEIPFMPGKRVNIEKLKHTPESERNLHGLKILLVEDNLMNQFVARQILSKWKANLTIAGSGHLAIEKLIEEDFDLILMDLQMPEMSGYQATEYIRSKNTSIRTPSIPIIALTADAFAETKRKVLEVGMDDFITKPFNQEELYLKIRKHTEARK